MKINQIYPLTDDDPQEATMAPGPRDAPCAAGDETLEQNNPWFSQWTATDRRSVLAVAF